MNDVLAGTACDLKDKARVGKDSLELRQDRFSVAFGRGRQPSAVLELLSDRLEHERLPVFRLRQQLGGQAKQNTQAGREVDRVVFQIPVKEAVVDGLHRERIAFFGRRDGGCIALAVGRRGLGACGLEFAVALAFFGDIAHRAHDAISAAIPVAYRDAVLAAPAPASVRRRETEIDLETRRITPEMLNDRLAVGGAIVRVNFLDDVAGGERGVFRFHPEHAVEKGISAANLGLTPNTEGQTIRLRIPELNEERRKELAKVAHKYAEGARVAVRHVRRDGLEVLKKLEKDHTISEDDHKRQADLVQKATDQAIHDVDAALAAKEKEIMTV